MVSMVMAGCSLLDTLVGDACVGFYFNGMLISQVWSVPVFCGEVALLDARCRRGGGWPPLGALLVWNGCCSASVWEAG